MDDNFSSGVQQNNLLPLPQSLHEKVAIDRTSRTVYVERRYADDPLFLTWQDRNKSIGISLIVKLCEVDELSKLRLLGMNPNIEVDNDLLVRNHALEIIKKAAAYRASDIHFMLRGSYTEIQFVVKGELRVFNRFSHTEGEDLTRSIYQGLSKNRDGSYNSLEFQNGQIPGEALPPSAGLTSIRIVRGPCYPQDQDGRFMTLRLQYGSAVIETSDKELPVLPLPRKPPGELMLGRMGYNPVQIKKLMRLMDAPNGIVIFTGPTGSGKTSTMFEVLKENARTKPQRRLVTAEDPVEYPMDWAVQLAITGASNEQETGKQYAEKIRVMLRMAPNSILIGELRDPSVAVSALEAAVTGHQVITTLHVSDPFLFVDRLELMDSVRLNRRVFCDHKIVRAVVAQRILPKLCPHCSIPLSSTLVIPDSMIEALKTWGDPSHVRVKGNGCEHCANDGNIGRFAIAEIIVTDAQLMSDFIEHGSDVARNNYRKTPDSDVSLLESGINHVLTGNVDPREVETWVDLIQTKEIL